MTLEQLNEMVNKSAAEQYSKLEKSLDSVKESVEALNSTVTKSEKDMGINQTRVITAMVESIRKQHRGIPLPAGGRLEDITNIVEEKYAKKDPAFVRDFKLHAKDLMATGNGGEMIIEEYAAGFLDQLWDETVLPKLGIRFQPTSSGNLKINKIVEGVAAGYIGEGGTIDTSTIKFGHISLSVKKLMALVPISNDMIRYAHINTEALVRDQIIKELAQVADDKFFYGVGGEYEPLGISNTPGLQVLEGKDEEASRSMGLRMQAMLGKKNHSLDGAHWVMGWDTYLSLQNEVRGSNLVNAAELANGRWLGLPFHLVNRLENDGANEDLFLIKSDEVTAIQGMNVQIVPSTEATIRTADGDISAFAQDFTIVRALVEHDFKLNYGHAAVKATPKVGK